MNVLMIAQIAGVRVKTDQVDQFPATKLFRQHPGLSLVEPHEGCLNDHRRIEAKRKRDLQALQCVVAAVGISGIVGFAHAAHERFNASSVSERGRKREERFGVQL